MTGQNIEKEGEIAIAPQAPFLVKLFIVAFALSYITLAMYMVADSWVLGQRNLKWLIGFPADQTLHSRMLPAEMASPGRMTTPMPTPINLKPRETSPIQSPLKTRSG